MLDRIAASPSKSLLVMTCAFIAGVSVHAFDERPWFPVAGPTTAAVALLICGLMLRRMPRVRLACVTVGLVLAGVARFDASLPAIDTGDAPPPRAVSFTGIVASEPRESLKGTVLIMDRVFFSVVGVAHRLGAPVEVRLRVPVRADIGDALAWRCRLLLRDTEDRNRRDRAVAWSCMPAAPPMPAGEGIFHPVLNALLGMKRGMRALAAALLPEPDASVLLGLLIGDTGGIPAEVLAAFRATGTSHVLAVSGYNVHQVVEAAFVLLACLAVRRRRALLIVAVCLAGFTVLTGAQAPVVRAAVMGGLNLLAGLLGRRSGGAGPLAFAAAAMLCHDPSILRHDVGFRLSFAAVACMYAFGPILVRHLEAVPDVFALRRTCADTIAATIGTMPIALHDFGTLPLAGVPVNVLVVPLVPLVMAAGAAARLMLGIVAFAARIAPTLDARASAADVAVLYGWLALLWYALTRKPAPARPPPVSAADIIAVTYDR